MKRKLYKVVCMALATVTLLTSFNVTDVYALRYEVRDGKRWVIDDEDGFEMLEKDYNAMIAEEKRIEKILKKKEKKKPVRQEGKKKGVSYKAVDRMTAVEEYIRGNVDIKSCVFTAFTNNNDYNVKVDYRILYKCGKRKVYSVEDAVYLKPDARICVYPSFDRDRLTATGKYKDEISHHTVHDYDSYKVQILGVKKISDSAYQKGYNGNDPYNHFSYEEAYNICYSNSDEYFGYYVYSDFDNEFCKSSYYQGDVLEDENRTLTFIGSCCANVSYKRKQDITPRLSFVYYDEEGYPLAVTNSIASSGNFFVVNMNEYNKGSSWSVEAVLPKDLKGNTITPYEFDIY